MVQVRRHRKPLAGLRLDARRGFVTFAARIVPADLPMSPSEASTALIAERFRSAN